MPIRLRTTSRRTRYSRRRRCRATRARWSGWAHLPKADAADRRIRMPPKRITKKARRSAAQVERLVAVGRHPHPVIESVCVFEGGLELPIEGQAARLLKAGDAFQLPPKAPDAGGTPGPANSGLLIPFVVEKGKPLASPVA